MPTSTKPMKPLHKGMGLYQVFYKPNQAPDKSKPWGVFNLRTRSTEGRWHATKEEALAQARALYAKLGDKAKVQNEGVTNAFFFSASPATLLDGTDDGIRWVEAIAPKTYSTPAYGEVVINHDNIDRFISNLNDNVRGQDVAIDYEHGLDPTKGKKAAGWIRGARKNNNGNLELAVEFTEPAKKEIINKEWKYFSLEWDEEWLHPDGVIYQDVVMGGALTNRPVAKGLMPINFSEIFEEINGETPNTEFNETSALERSDPGLNTPIYEDDNQPDPGTKQFIPRVVGDPGDDPAIAGGWRRQTPEDTDVFSFTEEAAREYMTKGASALDSYLSEETTADDRELAKGILATTTELLDKDKVKYSEHTGINSKIKAFFTRKDIEDKNAPTDRKFSTAEAIGYLTSAKKGLNRIHTNAGNALIERIDKVLEQDYRKRSMSELQTLVNETRAMLRGEDDDLETAKKFGDNLRAGTTTHTEGGKTVGELTEKDLRELRNVLDVDDDGKILEAVQHSFGELAHLRDAVSASEQEKQFAEQYPQFYAEHRKMLERDRRNTARDFSEGVKKVRRAEGLGLKTTTLGLSSAAEEKLIEAHMKFSEGRGTLDDFEECIKNIMHGGMVQFGEVGTSGEEPLPEVNGDSSVGVAAARRVFAEAIQREQTANPELDYQGAIQAAAAKHPDLAELYKVTLPA